MTTSLRASQRAALARGETEELRPTPPLRPATRIGPYEILERLGRGGIGVVYKAKVVASCSVAVGRLVALKMLHEGRMEPDDRRRFEREALYLQALRHPGIVRVLDIGEHLGRPYLVMHLVEGLSLDQVMDTREKLTGWRCVPVEQVIDIAIQSLEALHTAHIAGILHRDIKPGNLMVDSQGAVRLLDFGLAQRLGVDSRLTATGSVIGTPAYMSPEQAAGERDRLSLRSDIYAMGAVCYELATGRQPFEADNSVAVLRAIISDPLRPPRELRSDLPADLEMVILIAMAREPLDRYQSAEAMAEDLRRLRAGQRIRARQPGRLALTLRTLHRHRRGLAIGGLAAFVLASAGALTVRRVLDVMATQRDRLATSQALDERLSPKWLEEWRHAGSLTKIIEDARPHPILGAPLRLITLPNVPGNVRLSLRVRSHDNPRLDLSINDRDVGQGYTLRLESAAGRAYLSLLRGIEAGSEAGVVAEAITQLPPDFLLTLRRQDSEIVALIDEQQIMRFLDVVPIEGQDSAGTTIAVDPSTAVLADAVLERQRLPELVSQLAAADVARQDGRFARALAMYQAFLRDFPASPDAIAARYRLGLCLAALERHDEALTIFREVARAADGDEIHQLASIVQAWRSVLELGRYDEAERWFVTLRDRLRTGTILSLVPRQTLEQVARHYLRRAVELRADDIERALSMAQSAATISDHLGLNQVLPETWMVTSDLLAATGRYSDAIDAAMRLATDEDLPPRTRGMARLKAAEAHRLRRDYDEAMEIYLDLGANESGELGQWSRLWLGDLLLYLGDANGAIHRWRGSTENQSRPGRIMSTLVLGGSPLPVEGERWFLNDVQYFNAVLASLSGDHWTYRDLLSKIIASSERWDWPTALARQLLEEEDGRFRQP